MDELAYELVTTDDPQVLAVDSDVLQATEENMLRSDGLLMEIGTSSQN